MDPLNRSVFTRWLTTLFGLVMLTAACFGSLVFLYGGGSWQTAARLEATNLSSLELSELVGTSNYLSSDNPSAYSLPVAIADTLRLPFTNPLGMVMHQFPKTISQTNSQTQSQSSFISSLSAWQSSTKKVALGWVTYNTPLATEQMIQDNPGITVVSPQWLSVQNASGALQNHIEPTVVQYAHNRHIKVWAMLDNQFNAKLTHDVLSSAKSRQNLVNQVLAAAKQGHLDGINVDFENLRTADEANFTTFVQQLHAAMKPLHLVLSVDVTPDIVFLKDNAAFFHAALAAASDYVIVMAYDEHWGGDQTPGPVADVPWVTQSVEDLLDTGVPADKLILGIPFYTRFWWVHSDGSVTSQAYATSAVSGILQAHHAVSTWNNYLGVAFAKYPKPEGYMEVWYETPATLARKLALINNNDLAGAAVWSLGWSDKNTWSALVQALRQTLS
ncbi:glycoside hydrolase [Alicyclobacillus tolerans]|uniref:glycosyl hydrolase family 18 protein n=1 Tax=Alicyclobacillus tolerans TaxID=90970 RepID=UPI001F00507F|nr:glycosyl hydrolase family 18 protein [Alicyclobacillus tolerans]MCF8563648.1 glycoside hydrolase [Alicyclobacillus tolerans]